MGESPPALAGALALAFASTTGWLNVAQCLYILSLPGIHPTRGHSTAGALHQGSPSLLHIHDVLLPKMEHGEGLKGTSSGVELDKVIKDC